MQARHKSVVSKRRSVESVPRDMAHATESGAFPVKRVPQCIAEMRCVAVDIQRGNWPAIEGKENGDIQAVGRMRMLRFCTCHSSLRIEWDVNGKSVRAVDCSSLPDNA